MGLLGQIKSILNSDESPVQKERHGKWSDRRRRARLSHRGRKILIIDDSATVVTSLKKLLHSAGCVILEAADAETGLEIARENRPDLIFLDVLLPGMNGFAALRRIRRDARTRDIPVIITSSNEQAIEELYAKRIGADDFMRKPFSRLDVFSHVETLVTAEKLPKLDTEEPARQNSKKEMIAARRQLTAMGLQYFNQEQFSAAIERGDKLAVKLFISGGGVKLWK
ncbi:MAG: response regulator [Candidatus Accumulibacter sp.]|jgi:twitching motility two-component system response regulator PilH|nr:response regulator [Accumulibacter sp.]